MNFYFVIQWPSLSYKNEIEKWIHFQSKCYDNRCENFTYRWITISAVPRITSSFWCFLQRRLQTTKMIIFLTFVASEERKNWQIWKNFHELSLHNELRSISCFVLLILLTWRDPMQYHLNGKHRTQAGHSMNHQRSH